LQKWQNGIYLSDGKTSPAQVSIIKEQKKVTWLKIVMREGRKRQIRRVAAALGHPVKVLIRERIGPVNLGNMRTGEWRRVTGEEFKALQDIKQRPVRRQPPKGGTGRTRRRT
jgi:pseudouridine synthase